MKTYSIDTDTKLISDKIIKNIKERKRKSKFNNNMIKH